MYAYTSLPVRSDEPLSPKYNNSNKEMIGNTNKIKARKRYRHTKAFRLALNIPVHLGSQFTAERENFTHGSCIYLAC